MRRNKFNQEQMKLNSSEYSEYPSLSDNQMQQLSSWKTPDQQEQTPKQIVHRVQYGDTLQGLSLTYDVSIGKIKQRNKIQSDSIYYLKQIIIPNPKVDSQQSTAQTQYMKIQQFVMHMDRMEKSEKTARFYLSENDWDVQKAVSQYRKDLEWEKGNVIRSVPLSNYNPLQNMRRKNQ